MKFLAGLAAALLLSVVSIDAADAAPTVKLRSLELKELTVEATDASGKAIQIPVRYAELVRQVLLTPPASGNSTDDVVKAFEVWEPIKKVIDAKGTKILLSDADYQFLLTRLNGFHWGGIPEIQGSIADFIKYVRGLKEEEFAATPK